MILLRRVILLCSCWFLSIFLLKVVATASQVPLLKVLNVTETAIFIQWTPVISSLVEKYQVSAYPLKSYADMQLLTRNEWTYSNSTTKADLIGLQSGTLYNISVWARLDIGETKPSTQTLWTIIGDPEAPPPVEVLKREKKTMLVRLHHGTSNNGPITGTRVIVLKKSSIISLNIGQLYNYSYAEELGLPFYITAILTPEETLAPFTVGDAKFFEGYYNAPLVEDLQYEIVQEVLSSLNGETRSAYSPLESSLNTQSASENNRNVLHSSSTLSVILSAAIGMFGLLLVLLVIVYFLLRRRYGKRRPSDEMVLRVHSSEAEENGFVPGMFQIDEDTDLGDFYDHLKERYWQIPRSHLDVYQTVLGVGQFGEVREGVVHRRSQAIPCLVQQSQSPTALMEKEQRNLLAELDAMTRIGYHPHIVEFVGACDEREVLHVVVEHHSSSLRGLLLRSRQQADGRVSNLSEMHLLETAVGIAQGMAFLADHGILHHRLSSRSILMVDGCVPKVTNFGLSHFNPLAKKIDYTRWTAPESLRSINHTVKSDVWSFGVLVWEICTLGGTPYVAVATKEVPTRLLRGMRLSQPKGVSDELYQLLLHCWELDLDERPTFQELTSVLQNMLLSAKDHIRLEDYPGFQYEKFDPSADEV